MSDCSEHCSENRNCYGGCGGFITFMLVIFLSTCWGYIRPTEYGLLKNSITGSVDFDHVYNGGRHFIGWGREFIIFPAQLITLSFGNKTEDERAMIQARTGPGDGEDSGGQPVGLSLSFQYRLMKTLIPQVYRTFGNAWETTYMRLAQQAVTNVAQDFTPRSFWQSRSSIERAMMLAVNQTLMENGYAFVDQLQLASINFQSSYEQTITNIQLQEQLKVTKQFQLQVTEVLKEVDILQSQTTARITKTNAEAQRIASVTVNDAEAESLLLEQREKASMYAAMKTHLSWTQAQFLEYVKMKSLNTQPTRNIKMGVTPVGATS